MKPKRKQYSGAFKAKIGLEALSASRRRRRLRARTSCIRSWWRNGSDHSGSDAGVVRAGQSSARCSEKLIAQLHQKIGQLTVDLDWLKKKSRQLGLSPDEN